MELMRNARDAHASSIFIATSKEKGKRSITVIDNGCGIPAKMHHLVFEPRVTSKLDTNHMDAWGMHGRGMALYSISVNAENAYVADSDSDLGTAVKVVASLENLSEKADQSTFPTFTLSESNNVHVTGPKNILRTVCEFAIDSRAHCQVYIGSPSEICATLYGYGISALSTIERLFCRDVKALPLTKRLATAADPAMFAEIAEEIGLEISTRTARRVLDGEIDSLDPILERVVIDEAPTKRRRSKGKGSQDQRGLKVSAQDRESFSGAVMDAFEDIAQKYYLEAAVEPKLSVRRDLMTISIPIVKKP